MTKPKPLDITKPIATADLAERINWAVENMPVLEPVAIVMRNGQEERTLELQEYKGATCWTDVEMDAKRPARSLCHSCELFKPTKGPANCQIVQQLYELCCRGDIATMVTQCKHFKPEEADAEPGNDRP